MKNVFNEQDVNEIIQRINHLTFETKPQWGKMNVAQMLAHCNVTYEMVYEPEKHPNAKATGIKKLLMKWFVKGIVCSTKPYPKNSRTAPQFLISDKKEFETEKNRLIGFIEKTNEKGRRYFDGKESLSFGSCTSDEWNNMFYKHLDHHLVQFGV